MLHVISSQILPRWGSTPIRSLRPSMVQAWVGEVAGKDLAPTTVESYYWVVAAVMKGAKRDRLAVDSPTDDNLESLSEIVARWSRRSFWLRPCSTIVRLRSW
jgi:hypothetical protein